MNDRKPTTAFASLVDVVKLTLKLRQLAKSLNDGAFAKVASEMDEAVETHARMVAIEHARKRGITINPGESLGEILKAMSRREAMTKALAKGVPVRG